VGSQARFLSLMLLLGSAAEPAAAQSQPAAPGPRRSLSIKASAPQLLQLAAQLERRGDRDKAAAVLKLLESDPHPDVRNEARYRHAAIMESDARYRDAAVLLRKVLDEKPNAAAVRLKLATVLQKMGDEGSALRELRALRTIDLPTTVARFVDRLSDSLRATKPLGFQVEVALAPDSNINRATRSDTLGTVLGDFTLDEESKARSGVGVAIRGMAQARQPITDGVKLVARASGEARLYRDKDHNDISLDLTVGPEFQLGSTRFSAEAGVVQQWYGMEPYQFGIRLAGSATRPVGPTSQIRGDVGFRTVNNRLNVLQDGHGLSARVRYERALSSSMLISASIGLDRFNARDDAYSTKFIGGGVTAYRDIGRVTLSTGVEAGILKADERLLLLPKVREDRLIRFQVSSVFRQLTYGGFSPMIRLVVERNKSTVEFYDYARKRMEVGVVRAF
jgi:tetratricopeptide (TPR) repeat protein